MKCLNAKCSSHQHMVLKTDSSLLTVTIRHVQCIECGAIWDTKEENIRESLKLPCEETMKLLKNNKVASSN
jgi:hypothetical protein